MLLPKAEVLVAFGGGEATARHLLVRHVRGAVELARPRSHAPPGAVGRAVAVEVEAVRKGRFVEEVGGQIVLKIWRRGTREEALKWPSVNLLQPRANGAGPMSPLKCLEVTRKQMVTLAHTVGVL